MCASVAIAFLAGTLLSLWQEVNRYADSEFRYSDLLPTAGSNGAEKTPYRLITTEGVSTVEVGGRTFLQVEPEAIRRLTEEAIAARMIGDLGSYETLRREQKYGQNSRIDLLLDDPARGRAYVEVKNVHLRRAPGLAEFPDTRTARGAKHLRELGDMAEEGHRAIMVFLIQRADCDSFRLCRDLDPDYAREFDRAIARGVEAFAVRCHISQAAIAPERLVAIDEAILRAA